MGILTLALRIDNPSNGFENTFFETYEPPIQFHRQFCELAHSTMVLLCFLRKRNIAKPLYYVQVRKTTYEIEREGRNFLKIRFQNHWKGCQI